MKLKLLALAFTIFSTQAVSNPYKDLDVSDIYHETVITKDLANTKSFVVLIHENKMEKVFLSKNMSHIFSGTGGDLTTYAVQCNKDENEVCTTVMANDRVVKQGCECVPGGGKSGEN